MAVPALPQDAAPLNPQQLAAAATAAATSQPPAPPAHEGEDVPAPDSAAAAEAGRSKYEGEQVQEPALADPFQATLEQQQYHPQQPLLQGPQQDFVQVGFTAGSMEGNAYLTF